MYFRSILYTVVLLANILPAGGQAPEPPRQDLEAIVIPHQDDVRGNITLPTRGLVTGAPISWRSSNPAVVSAQSENGIAAGVVVRPKIGSSPATVTLTARVAGYEKEFVLKVQPQPKSQTPSHYLFAFFTSGPAPTVMDEQIYFATSANAAQWQDLNQRGAPALVSTVGEKGARDPFLLRSPEGDRFFMLATDLSTYNRSQNGTAKQWKTDGSKSILVWETLDLGNWGEPRLVDLSSKIVGAGYTWAPEAIWDPAKGQYILFWATRSEQDNLVGSPENMYYSTTRDFVSFSEPVKWVDRLSYAIDATMIHEGGWWYRAYGNAIIEKTRNPYASTTKERTAFATSSEWQSVGDPVHFASPVEGPEFFRFNPTDILRTNGRKMRFGLMVDRFSTGEGYITVRASELGSVSSADWLAADDIDLGPVLKRHGSILPITKDEFKSVINSYRHVVKK